MSPSPSTSKIKSFLSGLCFSALLITSSFFLTGFSKAPQADELLIDDFSSQSEGSPKGWKALELPRKPRRTEYTVQKEGDNHFLKAVSSDGASAIYKEFSEDLKDYPVLSWRWKVEGILKKGDETKRSGDDYAARVYVAFEYEPQKTSSFEKFKLKVIEAVYGIKPPGFTINYIWANKLEKEGAVENPFTNRVMMVAVESGAELAGQWIQEERNIYEDYKKYFKDEPPKVTGIVIMTDTDNTKESAVAYYDDIRLKKKLK
ncbi:MAG: DUF3047 domain-containing protein [Deltaproteobacteria bacterium]|nr:DUF3047 domain-containing protein [Deltaproteobacteria bacterium]